MKRISFCLILQLIFLLGCKKEQEINPQELSINDEFIKSIKVKGATEVKLDSTRRIIQVILPESFTDDLLDLDINPGDGMELEYPGDSALYIKNHIRYYFRATYPQDFKVYKTNVAFAKENWYTICVKHEGPLKAILTSELTLYPNGQDVAARADFKIISGLGSIPETPGGKTKAVPVLKDPAQNVTSSGYAGFNPGSLVISEGSKFLKSDRMLLSITLGDKTFQFPEIRQIKVSKTSAQIDWNRKLFRTITKGKTMRIHGGVFFPANQYRVQVSNDRLGAPRWYDAKFLDYGTLAFELPQDLPDDQYLFNIYEGNAVVGKSIEPVAADSVKASVGAVWSGFAECPIFQVFPTSHQPISLNKGQTLYAMPFPIIFEGQYGKPIDPNKPLPDLELKSGGQSLRLQPEVKADWCYADGSMYVYYGVYKVPAAAQPGKYEARFILDKNERSMPYWTQIEIR